MRTSTPRGGGAVRLHHRIRAEDAMVTAEFAVGLLAVLPLMFAIIALTGAAAVQVKAVEAARTAARVLARGESQAAARDVVEQVLPGSSVTISMDADTALVHVEQPIASIGIIPAFSVHAQAVTPVESST